MLKPFKFDFRFSNNLILWAKFFSVETFFHIFISQILRSWRFGSVKIWLGRYAKTFGRFAFLDVVSRLKDLIDLKLFLRQTDKRYSILRPFPLHCMKVQYPKCFRYFLRYCLRNPVFSYNRKTEFRICQAVKIFDTSKIF